MPDQTFQITAPDGRQLEITGSRIPTESELKDIFAKLPPPPKQPPSVPEQTAGHFVRTYASDLNPVPLLKTLGSDEGVNRNEAAFLGGMGAPPGLGNVIRGIGQTQVGEFQKAKEAYGKGEIGNAVMYGLSSALPMIGPAITGFAEGVKSGDYVGSAAHAAALATPIPGAKFAKGAAGVIEKAAPGLATTLERGAVRRMVDVMAPKTGANKSRFGNMAQKVAGDVVREPGMAAGSRTALHDKVLTRMEEASDKLDDAGKTSARASNKGYETGPFIATLEGKLDEVRASSMAGPEAHAEVERLGLGPQAAEDAAQALPEYPPAPGTKFSDMHVAYRQELRRLAAELEEFQYQEGHKTEQITDVRREGGVGTGRGARVGRRPTPEYVQAEGGTPVYQEILQGKKGTTRNAMIKSLRRFINGEQKSTPVVERALGVANKRLRTPELTGKPMLPPEAGFDASDAAAALPPVDVSGPIGKDVITDPVRAAQIQKAIQQLKDVGPIANYDALLKIRKGFDPAANAVYHPSITADYMVKKAEGLGAADVTGVLREGMAVISPETAAANADFHLWKSAHDVMKATAESERVRPRVGRRIVMSTIGAIAGAKVGGFPSVLAGAMIGPGIDSVMASGVTTKIATARLLTQMSDALKKGNRQVALLRLKQFAAITGQGPKLKAALAGQSEETK